MAIDTATPRTRRTILAGALGGLAAWAASALGRPEAVSAHDPDDVELGAMNTVAATTTIQNSSNANTVLELWGSAGSALRGFSTGYHGVQGTTAAENRSGVYGLFANQSGHGVGVLGENKGPGAAGYNVGGLGNEDAGVFGDSISGTGVLGITEKGNGVWGWSLSPSLAAILGQSLTSSTGVLGYSVTDHNLTGQGPAAPAKTGVYGYAAQDATAVGVKGESTVGTGGLFTATTGTALRVAGKAKFSRSGRASVPKGKTSVDIAVPGGIAANSVVHATLQTYRAGVSIAAVRTNYPVAGKARIYLTKVASTTVSTSVGWFVAEY